MTEILYSDFFFLFFFLVLHCILFSFILFVNFYEIKSTQVEFKWTICVWKTKVFLLWKFSIPGNLLIIIHFAINEHQTIMVYKLFVFISSFDPSINVFFSVVFNLINLVISIIIPEGRSRWYAISRLIHRWFSIHWRMMHIVRKICSTCWLFSSLRMSFTRCCNGCPLPRTVRVAFLGAKMKVMKGN